MAFFTMLCIVGMLTFYLAPSEQGQLDQIYSTEATTVKIAANSSKQKLTKKSQLCVDEASKATNVMALN